MKYTKKVHIIIIVVSGILTPITYMIRDGTPERYFVFSLYASIFITSCMLAVLEWYVETICEEHNGLLDDGTTEPCRIFGNPLPHDSPYCRHFLKKKIPNDAPTENKRSVGDSAESPKPSVSSTVHNPVKQQIILCDTCQYSPCDCDGHDPDYPDCYVPVEDSP